jgi:hypothetical protein
VGTGAVGIDEGGNLWWANQYFWPVNMKGSDLGSQSTFLEFVGLVIPYLLNFKHLKNQHIVSCVDNMGCVYGWESGYARNDNLTSILIRLLVLISIQLNSIIYIEYVPRCSSWDSMVADRLSQMSTTRGQDKRMVENFGRQQLPKSFEGWLENPSEDWNMPIRVVNELGKL